MATRRDNPYGAFNFQVEIEGVTEAGFSDVTGLGLEVTATEYREGIDDNFIRKVPTLYKAPDVTLKRGLIGADELWKWIVETRAKGMAAGKKNMTLRLRDEAGAEVMVWNLKGTWPSKWTGPGLAAKGSELAMEELVLSVDDIAPEI